MSDYKSLGVQEVAVIVEFGLAGHREAEVSFVLVMDGLSKVSWRRLG